MDLSDVPSEFRRHITGTSAQFGDLGWTELPDWITNLTDLTLLDLSGNRLTHIPDTIGKLTNLNVLNLSENKLTQVPDTIGKLTNLSHLYLYENRLTQVPDTIGNLTNLTFLAVSRNQLHQVPDTIGNLTKLTNLTQLDLSSNRLTQIPDTIGDLTNLTQLDLHENELDQVPDTIGDLTNLTQLDLRGNLIKQLPERLADILNDLLDLKLGGNPLADPLPELVARGNAELAAYLRSLGEALPQYEAKLLLVGEGNVGKSSLVAALKGASFVDGRSTTHGIEISPIPFRHPRIEVDMTLRAWDFGGQAVYRVSHQFFFTPRALYLVVWHARQGSPHRVHRAFRAARGGDRTDPRPARRDHGGRRRAPWADHRNHRNRQDSTARPPDRRHRGD